MDNSNNGKGLSIAALVLGIVAILFFWMSVYNIISVICGIVGLVCAVKGKGQAVAAGAPTGLATAGLVLSIIGTVLGAIGFFTCTVCILCAAGSLAAL